ncbi:hypothetical protein FRC08_018119 [Ceratobasidium sp. 394]|nr:hypothetical protein FRC08_018119 [Ceratobasidium sp. 394]KAG9074027.1 hypothetical protein FS749_014456 [Ceratobasidium sp. UAMH 11750]
MFEAQSNDGYYTLGLHAAENVCSAVAIGREVGARWESITGVEGGSGPTKAVRDQEDERIEKKTEEERQKLDAGQVPPTEAIPPDGKGGVAAEALRTNSNPPAPPGGSPPKLECGHPMNSVQLNREWDSSIQVF